jgi:hypothetical protein
VASIFHEAPGWQAICNGRLYPGGKAVCPVITRLDESHLRSNVPMERKIPNSIAGNLSQLFYAEVFASTTTLHPCIMANGGLLQSIKASNSGIYFFPEMLTML